MEKPTKKMGEILIEKGMITEAQLHDALSDQKLSDKFLGVILKDKGLVTDQEVAEALSEQFGVPLVDLKQEHIDLELARRYSKSLIIDHKCFPLRQDDYTVTVAVLNPLNAVAISKIEEEAFPRKVSLVIAVEKDLSDLIENYRRYMNESIQRLLKRKRAEGV